MKKIKAFILTACPYCAAAEQAWQDLSGQSRYKGLQVEWVNEEEHPEAVRGYDHYYCPAMFVDGQKTYEAHPGESYQETKAGVQKTMEAALA